MNGDVGKARAGWFGLYVIVMAWAPLFWFVIKWKRARGLQSFEFFDLPWWGIALFAALVVNAWLVMITLGQITRRA